jgi:hypothetical protein
LLRRTALVVGVGLGVCLVASLVVGPHARVDIWSMAMRIEVLALIGPGALLVAIAAMTGPPPRYVGRRGDVGTRLHGTLGAQFDIPPVDDETRQTIDGQNDALFAGGVVLIALGVALAVLA